MSLKKAKSTGLFSDETKYYKPSYRQKGGELRGSLYRGSTASAFTKKAIGSIPSKFETVLYPQSAAMRKGFGSNGFRFIAQVSENPGPGAYIDPGQVSAGNLHQLSDSYSRKGFGNGFVSTSERFRIDNYHPYQVPGPGAYKCRETSTEGGKRKLMGAAFEPGSISEKYKSHGSAVFSNPSGKRRVSGPTQPRLLGPGSYEIPRTMLDQQEYRCTAAFKAKGTRFMGSRPPIPGPGQYETDMEGIKREILPGAGEAISADFKLPSGSKRVKVNLYDPFENVEGEEKKTPGPGHYTADQFTILRKTVDKNGVGSSSMFASHDILDRFGKPRGEVKSALEKLSPGPGQYFRPGGECRDEDQGPKTAVTTAPFKSETKKGAYLWKKQGPGPAFYKVRSEIIRETKNLNPTKEWIQ